MDYEKIKLLLDEIQEMLKEIPQDCKGNSEDARVNRRFDKQTTEKSMRNKNNGGEIKVIWKQLNNCAMVG